MASREGYNFPSDLRRSLLKQANGVCECCQEPAPELFIHHILPVHIARDHFPHIPPMIVASALNAMCVCEPCHERENILACKQEQIDFILPTLLHAAANAHDDEIIAYQELIQQNARRYAPSR